MISLKKAQEHVNKNVRCCWYDACQNKVSRDLLDNLIDEKELLVIKTTYGKLLRVSEDVLILLHEEDNDELEKEYDCTFVPWGWIKSIDVLINKSEKEVQDGRKKTRNRKSKTN